MAVITKNRNFSKWAKLLHVRIFLLFHPKKPVDKILKSGTLFTKRTLITLSINVSVKIPLLKNGIHEASVA
jgi:hypothetical protein